MFRKSKVIWNLNYKRNLNRLIAWRISTISDRSFIYVLSLLVGLFSGLAAIILKRLVYFVAEILTDWFDIDGISYWYLVYPLIGITLTVLFVRYIVKDNIGHGVSKILYSISSQSSRIKPHNSWTSMVASSLTIGFGGSVGAEAPIVLTGASIGSNLARLFKLNYKYITLMLGCGVAGAISGIFNAPIAGIIFTLEVLMLDLSMGYLIPLLISSITANILSYLFMAHTEAIRYQHVNPFQIENLGYYILLGIFTGLLAFYFTRMTLFLEKQFSFIKHWGIRLIIGGVILGVLIFLFPPLWGEGYTSITTIFDGRGADLLNVSLFFAFKDDAYSVILVLGLILIFKVFAMTATTGSGGIGGIFAPTLFMGAIAGYFLVTLFNTFFKLGLPEDNFSLAGMAGMMAAVMHAPLTAIFLTAEITGGYGLLIPLLVTSTVAYLTIMQFEPHSIYTKRLAQRGELITHHKDKAVLHLMQAKKLIETDFAVLAPDATLGDLVQAISHSNRNLFPVVDEAGILQGMVKLSDVRGIIFEPDLYAKVLVKDLMYMPEYFIAPTDNMEDVAEKFETSGRYNLAVIDEGKYLGFISRASVFSKYRKTLQDFSNE